MSSTSHATPLHPSILALRTSLTTLTTALTTLDASIHDLPRLSRVLTQTRHFELLPECVLHRAQAQLLADIGPEMESLLGRVEGEVERMERREGGLRARWELQRGRLGVGDREVEDGEGGEGGKGKEGGKSGGEKRGGGREGKEALTEAEEVRLRMLRQKGERLRYAVERLTLQAQQRERQLRKSIAPQRLAAGEDG